MGGGEECEEVTGAQVHGQYPLHPRTGATGCLEGDVSEDAEACEDTHAQQARRQQRSDRQAAYSFSQKQAVDRHTNAKTPEPELEPECGQA